MRKSSAQGSALLLFLSFLALLSSILLLFLQTTALEKSTARSLHSSYETIFATKSGLAVATAHLGLATSLTPDFLVGEKKSPFSNTPILVIGVSDLTNTEQLLPLISGDLSLLKKYPHLPTGTFHRYLQTPTFTHQDNFVDLNKKNHPIASRGTYLAPWVTLLDDHGKPKARYAYIFLDEQARINPALHQGRPRTDPENWDQGTSILPLYLGKNSLLLSQEEASKALLLGKNNPTLGCQEKFFETLEDYQCKKIYLTDSQEALPDLIPATLPEGGHPKYDLNDLATNKIYGATPSARATNIALIIDRNLPHFKERDPSLIHLPANEQRRYLYRLSAGIVDYINPPGTPTLVNGGEPAGQNLTPQITQTAERCALSKRTSNSVTIDNQYFIQVWNPYTKTIPAGSTATFSLKNRQRVYFGKAPASPFDDYEQSVTVNSPIRPNESIVLAFPTLSQTWISPETVPSSEHPRWIKSPESNRNPTQHQAFEFYWNHALVSMSRRPPVGPGPTEGGLEHDEQSLSNTQNFWQCNFIPTEKDHLGHFRFVGDPRSTYLSNYLWKSYSSQKSYIANTRWKGVMNDASSERLFSPAITWIQRDFIPINPPPGNHPHDLSMTPEQVPSSYQEKVNALMAPFVLRNAPMHSIVELGHINDPAQADDLGEAPRAGSSVSKSSIYASGGGRSLHIGEPEFSYPNPASNWNTSGKRAIELIDIFTVTSTTNSSVMNITTETSLTNSIQSPTLWRKGLININTASHAVLSALFYHISPTSDARFTHSKISTTSAEHLATFIEQHRPYEKLSDLHIITPLLANATTYTPTLASNVISQGTPLAAVFHRAREESFGKMLGLCTVQSRAFRVYVLGQSLNPLGKATGEAMLEATLVLQPQKDFNNSSPLIPIVKELHWLR